MKLIYSIAIALVLGGCEPYAGIRTDAPIYDGVKEYYFADARDLIFQCVKRNGYLTYDKNACMIQRKGECWFLIPQNDGNKHKPELTALCNGLAGARIRLD